MVAGQTSRNSSAIKLANAVKLADKRMQPFRDQRLMFLRQYVGPRYQGWHNQAYNTPEAEPMNTIFSFIEILCPNLVGQTIFAAVTTDNPQLRPFAELLRLRLNRVFDEIRLAETVEQMVIDALFTAGIVKTGHVPEPAGEWDEPMGYLFDPDKPFADNVDLDDWILDPDCRRREAASLEGNRYTVPRDWAYDVGLYNRKLLDSLEPSHYRAQGGGADERAAQLSQHPARDDRFVPFLQFIDVWVPHLNLIQTLPGRTEHTQGYLREAEYDGPEMGPYDVLGFAYPPSNAIPIAPVSVMYDMHLLLNVLGRKLKRQAERQKVLGLYSLGAERDALTIKNAVDGELVGITDVANVKEFTFGGVDPQSYQPLQFFQEWQNRLSGNPDLLGGQRAQSETLGQDEMLMTNAMTRLGRYRMKVHRTLKQIIKKIAWYVWTDEQTDQSLTLQAAGMDIPMEWQGGVREGDFLDFNFDIEPYSLMADSPEQQYKRTVELVNLVAPLQQQMAAQGSYIDVAAIVQQLSNMRNLKETDVWFKAAPPQMLPGGGGGLAGGGAEGELGAPRRSPGGYGGARLPQGPGFPRPAEATAVEGA